MFPDTSPTYAYLAMHTTQERIMTWMCLHHIFYENSVSTVLKYTGLRRGSHRTQLTLISRAVCKNGNYFKLTQRVKTVPLM